MIRKLITLAISVLILGAIYYKIDVARVAAVFANADPAFMTISLGMVVPLTLLTAWRLQLLAPARANISFAEAIRLILAASTLNMILPSKMGDIAKAYFMKSETARGSFTLSLVIFEKTIDMLSLLFWCALGLFLYPRKDTIFWILTTAVTLGLVTGIALVASRGLAAFAFASVARLISGRKIYPLRAQRAADWTNQLGRPAPSVAQPGVTTASRLKELPSFAGFGEKLHALQSSWQEMQEFFWADKARVMRVSTWSIFIWFLHLLQIWLFILALRAFAPFVAGLALAPLAILGGLLPFTFAGIGTRDAALIVLYKPYIDAPVAAALGLLCTTRYVIPAIAGLPFLQRYLEKIPSTRSAA